MALLLKIVIESTRKASLSFIEGDKQYVQDLHGCWHRPRRVCHLLKTLLGYYSQKCRTPLSLARAHRWRSLKMFPAGYCSLDRLFLTKTLPFRCFHILQQINMTKESKSFRCVLGILSLEDTHHSSTFSCPLGISCRGIPTLEKHSNQT